ncbi:MAG TPA: HD domain-containing phosphohydrolase [Gemmatimonadota bacterium]|nr:HD domain-containing phosphohydrolase [Gemmatimonadota bacterium]
MTHGPRPHGGPPDPQGRAARVLVVDDERSILALVQTLLKPCEVDCAVLDDPSEAVALLRREPVDVLVCDAHLSAGAEADPVGEARRLDPATAIILTTRHRAIGREPRASGNEIYDCLKKPFEMGRLPTLVLHALERRRLIRENDGLRNVLAMHRIRHAVDAYLDDRLGFDVFLKSARMAVTADRAGLYAGRAGGAHVLELGSGIALDDHRSELGRTVARRVIDTGSSLKFPDAQGQGLGLPNGVQSVVGVPIRTTNGEVAGALVAMRERGSWLLNGEHLRTLDHMAGEAAVLMARSGAIPTGERPLEEPTGDMLRRLVSQLDRIVHEPIGHSLRLAEFALRIAAEIGLPARDRDALRTAALLHDVGNVAVRSAVLMKPGPLTESERMEVQRHVEVGKALLEGLGIDESVIGIVEVHHERFNGSGYPQGLAGEQIHPAARILALADTLEAMTMPRPYRAALTYEDVVEEISRRNAGKFDPALVRAFLAVPREEWDEIRTAVEARLAREREPSPAVPAAEEVGPELQRQGEAVR